jgi:DNA-binding NarL/FixJ family response regulator
MDGAINGHPIIALVDHRELTRTALIRSLDEALPGAVCIGAAHVEDLERLAAGNLRVVILHIGHTHHESGSQRETIAAARRAIAPVPLATLAENADESSLRASIEAGASAHLTTQLPLEIAAATLRLVMLGGTSFPGYPSIPRHRATNGRGVADEARRVQYPSDRLTLREEEVLKLVGQGAPNKMIAYRLNMSQNTVKVHLHRILQKLQLHNRTEAALAAGRYLGSPRAGAFEPPPVRPENELPRPVLPEAS